MGNPGLQRLQNQAGPGNAATRPGSGIHSIIDLSIANPEASLQCVGCKILDTGETTGSDHEVIEWDGTEKPLCG